MWRCLCRCGKETIVDASSLRCGNTKSCGCLRVETRRTHGHVLNGKKSPTYVSWQSIISRCTHSSNPSFEHYKKRGIKVCDRWRTFENFLIDSGERPSLKHSIDRYPDNSGNYEPGNVRWATKQEQANNRITNLCFEWRGKRYSISDLARISGVSKEILRSRLCRSKLPWTVEGAVSTPRLDRKRCKEQFYC